MAGSTTPGPKPLLLSFDTDWAPAFVLEEVVALLDNIPATFLVTDADAAATLSRHRHLELGIHPNFMPGSSHGNDRKGIVKHIMGLVPGARVSRSHNLCQDTTILDILVSAGIEYDLSLLEYHNPNPRPFRYWNGLIRVPYNLEDDVLCQRGDSFRAADWVGACQHLFCDFHPIHIYLNTENMKRYEGLRSLGPLAQVRAEDLKMHINRTGPGLRTLFCQLIQGVKAGRLQPYQVSQWLGQVGATGWAPLARKTQRRAG